MSNHIHKDNFTRASVLIKILKDNKEFARDNENYPSVDRISYHDGACDALEEVMEIIKTIRIKEDL